MWWHYIFIHLYLLAQRTETNFFGTCWETTIKGKRVYTFPSLHTSAHISLDTHTHTHTHCVRLMLTHIHTQHTPKHAYSTHSHIVTHTHRLGSYFLCGSARCAPNRDSQFLHNLPLLCTLHPRHLAITLLMIAIAIANKQIRGIKFSHFCVYICTSSVIDSSL